jgi:hypothetical protein
MTTVPTRKLRRAEQVQIDHRVLVGEFPRDEERDADQRHQTGCDDDGRTEPILFIAVVEHELQAADADDQQREPDDIDGQFELLGLPVPQDRPARRRRKCAHRQIDIEQPWPGQIIRDPTADDRSENRRDDDHHGP